MSPQEPTTADIILIVVFNFLKGVTNALVALAAFKYLFLS